MLTQSARPQTFTDVAGQKIPKALLTAIVKSPKTSPKSIILCGGFGCGKCVLPETRVATSDGYKKIVDLLDGDEGFNNYETDVYTRYGVLKSSHWYKQSNCKVNLLHLANGEVVNGTDKHRILSYHNSQVDLHRTDALKVGDYILFPKSSIGHNWRRDIDLAYATGAWLGDGYVSNGVMGFCGTYEACVKFAKMVGWTGKIVQDKRREDLWVVRQLKTDNSLINLKGHSDTKEIPEYIYELDYESRIAFVQGLLDTDGTVDKYGRVDFTMKSEKLIKQLQELLHTLGITSKVTSKVARCSDYVCQVWNCNIPASQSGNVVLTKNAREFSKKESLNDRNILEVDGKFISEVIRKHRVQFPFRNKRDIGSRLSHNVKVQNALTERSLIKYKEFYGELPEELEDLIGYTYVKIVGKSEIVSDVYDLTVPEVHEFYCQGTYNHNTTQARIFAKALNCEHPHSNGDPCGKCQICTTKLDESPFYTEYDASQLKLDNVRQMVDTWFVSMKNGYRVIVFDECHLLSSQVQSALLKAIEEPPSNTFFMFCTTDVEKVLDTIRSRSLEIKLSTVSPDDMRPNLLKVAEENNISVDDEVLNRIIKVSKGHMRNAHMELDKYSMIGKDQYLELFKSSYDAINNYFVSLAQKNRDSVFKSIDEILQYPLTTIKDDFNNYVLQLTKSLVTEPSDVVKLLGANTLKLVKLTMSDWFKDCFTSDVELQTGLLCIYQIMSETVVVAKQNTVQSNARR